MTKKIDVIPYKILRNKITGNTASIYSCYLGPEWEIVIKGFTWRITHSDGSITQGLGRKPVDTIEEAKKIANNYLDN